MKAPRLTRLTRQIVLGLILIAENSCDSKKDFRKEIVGIWKVDSIEIYSKGFKNMNSLENTFWNFNEFNDLVFANSDSVLKIHYFKIKDSTVNCYDSKKDTSDWTYQLKLIEMKGDNLILQSIFDDNSAVKVYLTKSTIKNLREIVKQRPSNIVTDTITNH